MHIAREFFTATLMSDARVLRPLRDLYSVDTKPNEGKADRDWTVRTGLSSTVTQRLMISVTPMRRLAQFAGANMTNMTSRLRHRFLGLHNQAWHGGNVLAAKGRSRFRIHEDYLVAAVYSAWHNSLRSLPKIARSSIYGLAESGFDVTHLERDFLNLTAASADCGNEREKDTNVSSVHDSNPLNKFLRRTEQTHLADRDRSPASGPQGLD
jgi:hypothetical protein